MEELGIKEALKDTNVRGIHRKLALELSRLPEDDEFPEFSKTVEELKA